MSDGEAIIVMGVSGTGKTTVGRKLAETLAMDYLEGDDFHSPESRDKMRAGNALTDADRLPWLDRLAAQVNRKRAAHGVVASCSALKKSYRDRLRHAISPPLSFVCLTAERSVLQARLAERRGHFMPVSMVDSQLAAFESPLPGESALLIDASAPVESIIAEILHAR